MKGALRILAAAYQFAETRDASGHAKSRESKFVDARRYFLRPSKRGTPTPGLIKRIRFATNCTSLDWFTPRRMRATSPFILGKTI
jgi:hypothetical protein